jgi:hypothetical protein
MFRSLLLNYYKEFYPDKIGWWIIDLVKEIDITCYTI